MLKCSNKKTASLLFVITALIQFGSTAPMIEVADNKKTKITDLPDERWYEIFQYTDLTSLLTLRVVCKNFKQFVKKRARPSFSLKFKGESHACMPLGNIFDNVNKLNLYSYDFGSITIMWPTTVDRLKVRDCKGSMDSWLKGLKKLREFKVKCGWVCNDLGLKELKEKELQKLTVVECKEFTDSWLKVLDNLHELEVLECDGFNGLELKDLKNLQKLEVAECKEFTGSGLRGLKNLDELAIYFCEFNETYLKDLGLHKLTVWRCKEFTGSGLKELIDLCELEVCGSYKFNEMYLKKLKNLQKFTIVDCVGFTGVGLKELINLCELAVKACPEFTVVVLKQLRNLKKLTIPVCHRLDEDEHAYTVKELRGRGCKVAVGY